MVTVSSVLGIWNWSAEPGDAYIERKELFNIIVINKPDKDAFDKSSQTRSTLRRLR
jgi:hypothetical protein